MKLETMEFLYFRDLKIGSTVMFPSNGFHCTANISEPLEFMATNIFTKSLSSQRFVISEFLKDGSGLVRGNFYSRPTDNDFYLLKREIETRDWMEIVLMFIFVIPIWVLIKKIRKSE